ncbi:MAG: aminopeptidase [Candidatus Bathyarchaeota archaeon]|nr:MAG: aminopeptidase [Candidatus Bathyarchaeota archaeon]
MTAPSFVKRVVKTCLRIGKDDRVSILSWRHMLNLAESFAMECKKADAHVLIEYVSDRILYDSVTTLPIDFLETPNPFSLALAGVATAIIFIAGPKNPERQRGVPAERWMALSRADKPYYERVLKRKVRMVEILLGFVTPERAKTYGFDYQAWSKNVKESTDVEYEGMQKLGKKLAGALEKSKEVEITNPDGTDLHFTLENRTAHIYDGVISEDDINEGAIFAELPDGAVSAAPTEASAHGVLVSNLSFPQAGRVIESVSLSFEDGRVKSFAGGKNIEVIRNMWIKSTGDKDKMGWFTLGLNPKASLGFLTNSIVRGTVTIGIGENRELGGNNSSDYRLPVTLSKPTVNLDGKIIIKQGRLMLK